MMAEVVCPHCEGEVILVDTDEILHQCPHCDDLFEFELETQNSLDFEAELSEIDDLPNQNAVNGKNHKNKVKNQRVPKPYQDCIDEKFIATVGMQRLTKSASPIGLIWLLLVYFWKYYLVLNGFIFGIISIIALILSPVMFFIPTETSDWILFCAVIPLGIIAGKWSLNAIKDDFIEHRYVHLFIHLSTSVIELTGRRGYGLSTRTVINRIKITPSMILEPISETIEWHGEGGGSSTSYGLIFEDSKSSFSFWSNPEELGYIQTYIVQNFEVKLLPHREL